MSRFFIIFAVSFMLSAFAANAQTADFQKKRRGGATEVQSADDKGSPASGMRDVKLRAKRDFEHLDENGDERVSPKEWNKRGNFELLDKNADGQLDLQEMFSMYLKHGRRGEVRNPVLPSENPEMDPSYASDKVSTFSLDGDTLCGIDRTQCASGANLARKLGLVPTGLGPRFPEGMNCLGIDDTYAMDYDFKRDNKDVSHGGFDIPTDWDTPVLSVAAGTVVGRFEGENTERGVEIVIRHAPEDTGLPYWTYTQYAHLSELPPQKLGQRVRLGEVIGKTSNTGRKGQGAEKEKTTQRRPALHFVAWYSPVREFALTSIAVVPVRGRWLDPHAMYGGKEPFDSAELAKLPDDQKWVDIPVMLPNGNLVPKDTKMIWPYTCSRL
jgi:Peptidase family M23